MREHEDVLDPGSTRLRSSYDARLDGRFEALRMAVAADRQCLARELQQTHAGESSWRRKLVNLRAGERRLAAVRMVMPVRPALRLERSARARDGQAQALDHLAEHVIGEKAQAIAHDLDRDVPIAEMVSRLRDQQGIVAAASSSDSSAATISTSRPSSRRSRSPPRSTRPALDDQGGLAAARRAARAIGSCSARRSPGGPSGHRQHCCGVQNRKYRCVIGSVAAGSQTSNSPSARTS
jgi:hypothetical protein